VLDLVALPQARPGVRPLNLLGAVYGGGEGRATELNDRGLTLSPAPTNSADDPVDGSVVILGPKTTSPTTAAAVAAAAPAPAAVDAVIESVWGLTASARLTTPTALVPVSARKVRPAWAQTDAARPWPIVTRLNTPRSPVVFDRIRRNPGGSQPHPAS
jgi:hypothetical protein